MKCIEFLRNCTWHSGIKIVIMIQHLEVHQKLIFQ